MNEIESWLSGRLPDEWFEDAPVVVVDREEILVVGRLPEPSGDSKAAEASGDSKAAEASGDPKAAEASAGEDAGPARRAAEAGRIGRFREETRAKRMRIADEAEARFGRKVAWGAACGGTDQVFTSLAVPVMTRLRQPERRVLDTLIDAGVARSRSEALAWCVRLVGTHQSDWIEQLRTAVAGVQEARRAGPAA